MTVSLFISDHLPQLSITGALVVYSLAKHKLTPDGVLAAIAVAGVHMLHPWSVFYYLLVTFFLAGTLATKVHHTKKALLTQSATGGSSAESARNSTQVLANSAVPCLLILSSHFLSSSSSSPSPPTFSFSSTQHDILTLGVSAAYAAATADTLSSELGILAQSTPFLITAPRTRVPRGTNGGVTALGLFAGLGGGALIAVAAAVLVPWSAGASAAGKGVFVLVVAGAGVLGSVVDSVLGAVAQVSVVDKGSGRVVEGVNGRRVLVLAKGEESEGASRVARGRDWLNNNGVNFVMCASIALGVMGVGALVL